MNIFSLEQSRSSNRIDFALYGLAIVLLAALLWVQGPRERAPQLVMAMGIGWAGWSAAEYALHRFVLHGMPPFSSWHARHHDKPAALIGTPTALSAALNALLIFLPLWTLTNVWTASAATLGALVGYTGYALTHHAIHQWHGRNAWLRRRKRWHALHHHGQQSRCYGVSSGVWDHLLGTASQRVASARQPKAGRPRISSRLALRRFVRDRCAPRSYGRLTMARATTEEPQLARRDPARPPPQEPLFADTEAHWHRPLHRREH